MIGGRVDGNGGIPSICGKIFEAVDPDAVILLGSYARDQASSESDIDLLMIHSGGRRRKIQQG